MKQANRQRIANAIRAGLPYLWNGRILNNNKTSFICFAIDEPHGYSNDPDAEAAKKVIHKRIAPYTTVEDWLEAQGVKRITNRKLQAYRKAWMRSLIEEFSN
jgi:hypothetical protein